MEPNANGTTPKLDVHAGKGKEMEEVGQLAQNQGKTKKLCENCNFHGKLQLCPYCMKNQTLNDVDHQDFDVGNSPIQRISNPHDPILDQTTQVCKTQEDGGIGADDFGSQASNMNLSNTSSGISFDEGPPNGTCSNGSQCIDRDCYERYLVKAKDIIQLSESRHDSAGMSSLRFSSLS